MTESSDVVVIGAGPAGLAAGACLRRAGMNFIILEKEAAVGSSWRRHYDRLRLHTVKRYSSLPYFPFPRDYPRYVPRALMVTYLETYADHFRLSPRLGELVRTVRREGAAWFVESTSCSVRAPFVVVASGFNAEPVVPTIPGLEKFEGQVLHSADYHNARPFADRSVLVIGMGNTGAEIALDLAENGAHPTISLRSDVHIVPRELFGIPIQIVAMLATRLLPLNVNDVLFPYVLDFALGDLKKFGIKRPQQGLLQQIRSTAKIPVIDIGAARKISEGAIKIAPAITELTNDGACFRDSEKRRFDAIILATGYRANYASFLSASGSEPTAENARESGLYFVGFHNWVTGLLGEICKEATAAARDIADKIGKARIRGVDLSASIS
jgi:cation diffusion facilitator CzcD-associated flavoprotein CzcO